MPFQPGSKHEQAAPGQEPAKAGGVAVVQEWVEQRRLDVTSYDLPTLVSYVQSGKVSQAVVDAVHAFTWK